MRKHPSGFVPVNYKVAGKNLIKIGLVGLLFKSVAFVSGWFEASSYIAYFSCGLILVGLYLVFVVSKNKLI
jgi:hypothetical protein